jgi:arylsulfatase
MATLVDLTGADYPEWFNGAEVTPMQGESLLPALLGEKSQRESPLFWEWQDGQAVREGEWKLVRDGMESDWELYQVNADPTEISNLALQYPEKVEALKLLFLQWKERVMNE